MEKSTSRSAIGKTVSRREFLLASGAVAGYLAFQPSQMLAAPTISQTLAEMQRDFANPPDASKPWVYWWWLDGVATPEGITADLEEMKKKGINGLLLFDCGDGRQPLHRLGCWWPLGRARRRDQDSRMA
jgi:hypothetical protein